MKAFYLHCQAISKDKRIAYPNHKDDWRCNCEPGAGYSMSPNVLIPNSEDIIIGDSMTCPRCNREYIIELRDN